jgi:hypothetical protein
MAFLARLYDFTPSTLIQSAQVDAEFQQLVDILGGGENAKQVKFSHSGSTTGVSVNNTGGGIIQAWEVSGVVKARIAATGQIESVLTTGTAPLIVASATMVANLNADTVDGVHGTNLLVNNAASQEIDGGATTFLALAGDTGATLRFVDDDGSGEPNCALDYVGANNRITFTSWDGIDQVVSGAYFQGSDGNLYDKNDSQLASQSYVAARKTTWSFGVFYAGAISTGIKQAVWIIPNDEDLMTVTRVRHIFQSGSPTGTSQIKLWHKNSAGTTQNSKTMSILSTDNANQTYDVDVSPDWNLASGDYLEWTVVADGGHQDISIHAQGEQSIY